ncbi:MAG: DUF6612 family protein [Bacillota bacterium]
MKKSLFIILALMLLCTAASVPAMAEDVKVNVNSDSLNSTGMYITDGVTMAGLDDYIRFAGADYKWATPDTVVINEDGKELSLTIGQLTAILDGKEVKLPKAAVKNSGRVMIPLRFVSDAFGYNVAWNGSQYLVSLSRKETKDGMTPEELLAKAGQESQKVNTYTMSGSMDIDIDLSAGEEGKMPPQKVKTDLTGQFQNNPLKVHMKQTIKPEEKIPGMDNMAIETYMTENKMYMKMPGQEWTVMDMPFPADFIKQQQDIQSNPLKAVEQMKEMGMLCNYGNDITIDGQDYYVVNATLDMQKFREGIQKIAGEAMKSLPAGASGGDQAQAQKLMEEMFKNMEIDYFCTSYINKKTLISDLIKMDMKLKFDMSITADQKTEKISMSQNAKGEFRITDLGKPFAAPDVSKAVSMDKMMEDLKKDIAETE